VSPRISECELTHLERHPIAHELAVRQHDAYENALAEAGYELVRLPDLDDHPDSVFVEDTAILLGDHAIVTRPGAASRRPEADSTASGLDKHFEVHRLDLGSVDGGDVLRIGRVLYVGVSGRTDVEGAGALARAVAPLGYDVVPVELDACLHLKSAATWVDDGRVLLNPSWVDPAQFDGVEPLGVDPSEPFAANAVRLHDRLIVSAAFQRTAGRLEAAGFRVVPVDVSELQKAEAGVTCMSLIDERP
jgi:dimethylargininase